MSNEQLKNSDSQNTSLEIADNKYSKKKILRKDLSNPSIRNKN